jgi:hypothetical protein
LIGPRPLLPVDLPHQVGLRTAVRPGITGWAQINGDTLITAEEKNAMDEWYVRHACWKVEFAIVIATVRAFLVPIKRNEHAIAEALSEQAARREQDQQAQEAEQARPLRPSGDQVNCTGSEGKLHEMTG